MTAALRLGVVGATGTLGEELLLVLEEARLDLAELRPFAGKRSMGDTVEFAGASLPVLSGEVDFTGLDAVILCTPPAVSLELIRQALRVEAPCIDCSGALLASPEVPLVIADLGAHDGVSAAPPGALGSSEGSRSSSGSRYGAAFGELRRTGRDRVAFRADPGADWPTGAGGGRAPGRPHGLRERAS
jgi:hypothetical protein